MQALWPPCPQPGQRNQVAPDLMSELSSAYSDEREGSRTRCRQIAQESMSWRHRGQRQTEAGIRGSGSRGFEQSVQKKPMLTFSCAGPKTEGYEGTERLRKSAASGNSFRVVRRWWYCLIVAFAWMSSIEEVGRRGRRSRIMAAAFREPVCVSKVMARWIRIVGFMGETVKSGSLGQGRKSLSIMFGSSEARSSVEMVVDSSWMGE